MIKNCIRKLIRRKLVNQNEVTETKLDRCLNTYDLTFLGIGTTLGAGIYVVTGQVARDTAGPSIILSFAIAAFASVLAGLCYAEFGARVPKTGSAYVYSFVTVGEFVAFVIGWNLILEYIIGASSVAKAASLYFDSLIGKQIEHFLRSQLPMNASGLSQYPDFLAVLLVLIITVMLVIGVKESARFNMILTCVNLFVVTYIVICGFIKAKISNWQIPSGEIFDPGSQGTGGFFPFGVSGMMAGAATCFYAFVGFDVIATTGEEVKNPRRAIPVSIVASLAVITMAYISVSSSLTLMIPYFSIDPDVPLPAAFDRFGWTVAKYVIAVGALSALTTSLLGALIPLPRVIYAMAEDGLLFKFLSRVNPRFKTPFIATIIAGILSGLMACVFDLRSLINMMSIGTLLAYTLVAECILILRYSTDESNSENVTEHATSDLGFSRSWFRSIIAHRARSPTPFTSRTANICTLIMSVAMICFSAIVIFCGSYMPAQWVVALAILMGLVAFTSFVLMCTQPQNQKSFSFKMPLVPLLPSMSILFNLFLMLKLPSSTWIRFGVWMIIGLVIYFGYGIRNSNAGCLSSEDTQPIVHYHATDVDGNDDM